MASHDKIRGQIKNSMSNLISDIIRKDESLSSAIQSKGSLDLAINSSFLFRDKRSVKTLQSSRRLLVTLAESKNGIEMKQIRIIEDLDLRTHYHICSSGISNSIVALDDAVKEEVDNIGDVIFVLTGLIKGIRPVEQPVQGSIVQNLRLDSKSPKRIQKTGAGVYTMNRIIPFEDLLEHIAKDLATAEGLSENDRRALARAYDTLLDEATTEVLVATGTKVDEKHTILGKIAASLKAQATDYKAALIELDRAEAEGSALNEVLRIAYNFSTDVLPLLFLFMSICDLKPLIFWCTVDSQWRLYRAFELLPWSALGRKASAQEYRDIIAAARNQAFHHVLPFETTVEVDLSNTDVRAQTMRLFPPFGDKSQGGIRLTDQELIDVFAGFSRAKQRPVSTLFWRENLKVMEAATTLAKALLETLLLVESTRSRSKPE